MYYAQQLLPIKLLCIFMPNFLNGNEVTISLPFFSMRFSEGLAQNSANFLSFLSNSWNKQNMQSQLLTI